METVSSSNTAPQQMLSASSLHWRVHFKGILAWLRLCEPPSLITNQWRWTECLILKSQANKADLLQAKRLGLSWVFPALFYFVFQLSLPSSSQSPPNQSNLLPAAIFKYHKRSFPLSKIVNSKRMICLSVTIVFWLTVKIFTFYAL